MEYLPLVGRQTELTILGQELHRVQGGQGALVLISAEAGGGKSALVRALERKHGSLISVGYCPGPEGTAPYGPWLEAVRNAAEHRAASLDDLPAPFGRVGGVWTDRDRAAALAAWVRAGNGPCVVALEDIHWADRQSLDLLRHLPHFLRNVPLLLVATYRDDEVHRKHPLWSLLPELQRAGAVRLPLSRLAVADVAELVEAAFPQRSDGPFIPARLHARTAGHPFLVHELLVAAMRTGSVPAKEDDLPETALQMIDLKLARVPEEALNLLQAAALLGERFSPQLLGQVCELAEEHTFALLELAADHRIVHIASPEEAWFDHALLRQALTRRMGVLQRRRLHQRIADALLARPQADPEPVALHLSRGGDQRAPAYLLRAGDSAIRMGALTQAGDHYRRGLELVQADHTLRPELLLKLGFAAQPADRSLARTCWEEAAVPGTEPAVAAWAHHFLALWHVDQRHPGAIDQLEAVRDLHMTLLAAPRYQELEAQLFGSVSGYPRSSIDLVQLYAIRGRVADARQWLERIRGPATKGVPQPQLLRADIYVTMAEGRTTECCPMWERLSEEYLRLRDYRQAAAAAFHLMSFLVESLADQPDLLDRAAERTLRLETLAVERAGVGLVPPPYNSLGYYHFFRGNWDEARRHLLDYLRAHPEDRRFTRRTAAIELQFALGDYVGVREFLTYMEPLRPEDPPGHFFQLFSYVYQARLALLADDRATARAWLEAADRWDPAGSSVFTPYIAMGWAEYHRHVGDRAAALAAARRVLGTAAGRRPLYKQIEARRLLGELLAEQGDVAEAAEQFALAVSIAERCRIPYLLALAQLARTRTFPAAPGAAEDLAAALATLRRLGAEPALAEAETLLPVVTAGAPAARAAAAATALLPERALPRGTALPAGLTRREVEVALWVARGLTDKEVAAKLFLSRRTVDTHLRHIFGKVGVASRAALGAWVAEQGLHRYLEA